MERLPPDGGGASADSRLEFGGEKPREGTSTQKKKKSVLLTPHSTTAPLCQPHRRLTYSPKETTNSLLVWESRLPSWSGDQAKDPTDFTLKPGLDAALEPTNEMERREKNAEA